MLSISEVHRLLRALYLREVGSGSHVHFSGCRPARFCSIRCPRLPAAVETTLPSVILGGHITLTLQTEAGTCLPVQLTLPGGVGSPSHMVHHPHGPRSRWSPGRTTAILLKQGASDDLHESRRPKLGQLNCPLGSVAFTGRTDAEYEAPVLWPPDVKS